ncbi:MAG: hypothetical protein L6Q47_04850 [Ignavibacteriaceae bacterium]|nr:hypothetical protein [Ignavibacteriaceae bacterium]
MITSLFLVVLFIGCDSTTEKSSIPGAYLPLKVGNKWYYNSHSRFPDTTSIDLVWEVKGQVEINGIYYFSIIEHNLRNDYLDTLFYRLNGDTLFTWNVNNGQIIADFSLNLNDTAYWRNDLKVVQKTKDIMQFETPFGADYGYSISFQKGVGITNIIEGGVVYHRKKLLKAEIK